MRCSLLLWGFLKCSVFGHISPINVVSTVTTISELRIDAAGPDARAADPHPAAVDLGLS
ncbi:MAG: hypothetical protein J7456_13815 [Chloroflexus sp.]|nr:hypothetical protein [Chloroflexus sp.]